MKSYVRLLVGWSVPTTNDASVCHYFSKSRQFFKFWLKTCFYIEEQHSLNYDKGHVLSRPFLQTYKRPPLKITQLRPWEVALPYPFNAPIGELVVIEDFQQSIDIFLLLLRHMLYLCINKCLDKIKIIHSETARFSRCNSMRECRRDIQSFWSIK